LKREIYFNSLSGFIKAYRELLQVSVYNPLVRALDFTSYSGGRILGEIE
jgi:hypothetical protein